MIYLKPITKENIIPVTDLEMEDSQKGFVELIHYPDNDRAAAVYENAGFKLTGRREDSAPGRIERGSKDPNRTYEIARRRYYSGE